MSVATLVSMASNEEEPGSAGSSAEMDLAVELVRQAKEAGVSLTGPDGLLKQFTRTVLETALEEEMTDHLGRARHERTDEGRASNTRNGMTDKTVLTDACGAVEIEAAGVWWRCGLTRKDSLMSRPRKYDRELQERAVRLYEERIPR